MDQGSSQNLAGDQQDRIRQAERSSDVPQSDDEQGRSSGTTHDGAVDRVQVKEPLSLSFIHRPSRTGEMLRKASDPTRENSLLNSQPPMTGGVEDGEESSENDESQPDTPGQPGSAMSYQLVRKKSGEVVKSSMKERTHKFMEAIKRSRSLPSTPTYKQVHFGNDTDVRYFKEKDKPTAISASNSPTSEVDNFAIMSPDSEEEYSKNDGRGSTDYFGSFILSHPSKDRSSYPGIKTPEVKWELKIRNTPDFSYDRYVGQNSPVFLERVFISADNKYMIGHVAVKNLVFEKSVITRYTADNWLTIVELPTSYVPEVPCILQENNYDRFTFSVSLESLFNSNKMSKHRFNDSQHSQSIKYSLCIKFKSEAGEFWDNNNNKNYELELTRKTKSESNGAISTHKNRPKYSSSYMKRRTSDSQLDSSKPAAKDENTIFYSNDDTSSDYVSNDFYLSSPLLSSYNNSQYLEDTPLRNKAMNNTFHSIDPMSTQPKSQQEKSRGNSHGTPSHEDKNFHDNQSPTSHNLPQHNSYQELLDNYCFFSSSPASDENEALSFSSIGSNARSEVSNVSSPSPDSTGYEDEDARKYNTPRTDKIHTISTILNEDGVK